MRFENNGVTSSSQSAGVSNGASSVNGASSLKGPFATDMQSNGTSGGSWNGTTGKLEAGVGENGVLSTPKVSPPKTDYFGHDREEVSRILIQALVDLGYQRAASTLEEESEYTLESPCVSSFRDAVLRGEWSRAETLLYSMQIHQDADLTALLFYIRKQKFLELLEAKESTRALHVLRTELTPLGHDMKELHFLSSLMMCISAEDLRLQAKWDGASGHSRQHLLSELSKFISPSIMLPGHRLADLLQQVKQTQVSNCLYHSALNPPSLYTDHVCDQDQFPSVTSKVLGNHGDEVYCVKFSHDGRRLASSGKDTQVIIWDVETWEPIHILAEHDDLVTSLDWSPDDSRIVSCAGGDEKVAKIWDTATGRCTATLNAFKEPVSSVSWHPSGRSFVTSSMDEFMIQWDVSGEIINKAPTERFYEVKITPDGKYIAAVNHTDYLYVYDFADWDNCRRYKLDGFGRSLQTSLDSRHVIVNLSIPNKDRDPGHIVSIKTPTVDLIDLATGQVEKRYVGHAHQDFVVRATFGGAHEHFVVSGSEDSFIYVWHKATGQLVVKLAGHSGSVNCISWNPATPHMFASASDDHTIRIWSTGTKSQSSSGKMKGILNPSSSNGHHHQYDPYPSNNGGTNRFR